MSLCINKCNNNQTIFTDKETGTTTNTSVLRENEQNPKRDQRYVNFSPQEADDRPSRHPVQLCPLYL